MSDGTYPPFEVRIESDGPVRRIVLAGELDIATAEQVSPHVAAGSSDGPVLLDLRGVTFIDSTGLRLLLEAHAALGERLRIVPSPVCERLFDITGVRDRLPIEEP